MANSEHAREPDEEERDVIRRHVDAFASAHPYRDKVTTARSGEDPHGGSALDPVRAYTREQVERAVDEREARAADVPKVT